jgi:hypothetical protein
MLHLIAVFRYQGQQLLDRWILGHGIDELVAHQKQFVDLAISVGIEHGFHRANQICYCRLFTNVAYRGGDVAAITVEEGSRLGANQAQLYFNPSWT